MEPIHFTLKGTTDIITLVDTNSGIVDTVGWNFTWRMMSLVAPGTPVMQDILTQHPAGSQVGSHLLGQLPVKLTQYGLNISNQIEC